MLCVQRGGQDPCSRGTAARVPCTGRGRIPAAMQAPALAVGIGAVGEAGLCTSRTEPTKPALSLFCCFLGVFFLPLVFTC